MAKFTPDTAREAGRRGAEARRRNRSQKQAALEKIRTLLPEECPADLRTIEDCADLAGKIPGWVLTGKIDSETARVAVNAVAEARRVIDKLILATQLREVQAELKRLRAERRP